jgi:hypothetical protein
MVLSTKCWLRPPPPAESSGSHRVTVCPCPTSRRGREAGGKGTRPPRLRHTQPRLPSPVAPDTRCTGSGHAVQHIPMRSASSGMALARKCCTPWKTPRTDVSPPLSFWAHTSQMLVLRAIDVRDLTSGSIINCGHPSTHSFIHPFGGAMRLVAMATHPGQSGPRRRATAGPRGG